MGCQDSKKSHLAPSKSLFLQRFSQSGRGPKTCFFCWLRFHSGLGPSRKGCRLEKALFWIEEKKGPFSRDSRGLGDSTVLEVPDNPQSAEKQWDLTTRHSGNSKDSGVPCCPQTPLS